MKAKLFCFLLAILLIECISAQEHIKVKAESAFIEEHKVITITLSNTTDKNMQIWVRAYSNSSSHVDISFLDNHGEIVSKRHDLALIRDYEIPMKMLVIKPRSSESLSVSEFSLLGNLKESNNARYRSIKTFQVKYFIHYILLDEDPSLSSTHTFEKTSVPIEF